MASISPRQKLGPKVRFRRRLQRKGLRKISGEDRLASRPPQKKGGNDRRRRPGFDTLWEAELEIALYATNDTRGMRAEMCLKTAVEWYAHFERNRYVSERTIDRYLSVLRRLLTPRLASLPMDALQPVDLNIVLEPVRADELLPKSKDEYARTVGRFFRAARQAGFVQHDISEAMVRQNAVPRAFRHDSGAPQQHFAAVRAAAGVRGRQPAADSVTLHPTDHASGGAEDGMLN